ncbi:NAD-dependent epimerase/dehydratase family protein [Exiguobacterium acetylicum]|uniref:NAD-dependent epimerase/dehydratase family protein n=1 Tax=Exiguobacterium acetylicum TaxID=41170 RepID=UPI0011ED46E1|nr:NAD-dependent epimerase/dehydratase family protein [Exiguobacterium acetylicum]
MKKVLVTGENGYIGNKFNEWNSQRSLDIELHYTSVKGSKWKEIDFSEYDCILHLAGIAHVSRNPKMEKLYYKVNRDLTKELAEKAKNENVKQFIFMSSIIVYGNQEKISFDTKPEPSDFYGESKLQAEILLRKIASSEFQVAIIRSPMVYGESCKGNFNKLLKFALVSPVFPLINNKRSIIYIENLCNIISKIIINSSDGYFFPQNNEIISTTNIVKEINEINNKKVLLTSKFNLIIKMFIYKVPFIKKVFGDLYYEVNMSTYKEDYQTVKFKDSLQKI